MSAINYTYFVTIGALETQVYPSGDWSLKVTKAEEDFPYCKDYRIKFDGDFIFAGDDYTLLMTPDCCDKIDLKIKCNGVDYWFGYFAYPYDFKVDEDRCQISGTPKPLDKYYYYDLYADNKKEMYPTDELTYQTNYNPAVAPASATWQLDCIDCEPIFDIMDRFIAPLIWPVGFTSNLRSTFFNNDTFPDGTDPYPDGPGAINYVTGLDQKLNHVVMAMAKDVCDPTIAGVDWPEWSWNDVMGLIHNVFNTWWYIDEQGDVRVEHIYFWELYFPVSYDLTTIDGGRWIVNTSKYNYTVEEMPKEERWNWRDMMENFDPAYFTYYNCFLPGTSRYIKEYSLSNLTNDIEYVAPGSNNFATSPDCADVSSSDYLFVRCIEDTDLPGGYAALPACADYVAWFSMYYDDGLDHINAHLSPANLLANYWMHDRPFWSGTFVVLAGIQINFESTWKTLRQMEFCFPVCCQEAILLFGGIEGNNPRYLYQFGIDFNEFITTQYGDGELYTGTIKDGMLCLQLIFEDLDCEESATEWSDASEL